MPETVLPRQPVDNWEKIRDDWIAEINRLFHEVEAWSERQGWATLRDDRMIAEDRLGSYRVPVLLVHTMQGRVLLSPIARYVFGANGVIDLNVYPSFDPVVSLVHRDDGWRFQDRDREELGEAWSEESFVNTVKRALESA